MRPRVRSYGESSTATLSPERMRIKFLRILPETCARTWCLFSSSTRNMAFGNGSSTVAITSIASSLVLPESPSFFSFFSYRFAISSCSTSTASQNSRSALPRRPGHLLRARQDPRAIGGDRHSVLEMRRGLAIGGLCHPFIPHAHFRRAGVHHRLDRNDHAFLQARAASRIAVIREVRLVVHFGADAVSHEFSHHRVTVLLGPALHRVAHIAEAVARAHLIDGAVERLASHVQQLLQLRRNLPHRHGHRRIRKVAIHFHPEID